MVVEPSTPGSILNPHYIETCSTWVTVFSRVALISHTSPTVVNNVLLNVFES